ncbi:MAG: DUF72 domain-containing protein [Jatrophihabitantaceae bacterium]
MTGAVRIGISGWRYPPWRDVFYPPGLPQRSELSYASSQLSTIEINGSFYSLQRPESFRSWYAQTPDRFVFSVKGPRFITHLKKLRGVEAPLANFFASGLLALGEKLGPVLWQLPPSLGFDASRLGDFFDRLPRSTAEAAWLARHHDERVADRALTEAGADRPVRHALEVRHRTFLTPPFTDLLREHEIAVVVADTAGKWPLIREVTTDFAYLRLHGDKELYASGYTDKALDEWAVLIRGWADTGRDVFVYFDNDVKVRAPFDALALAARLKRPDSGDPAQGSGAPAPDRSA